MKRIIVITTIALLILALLGWLWWYLLVNGRPEGLGNIPNPFGGADTPVAFPGMPDEQTDELPATPAPLWQVSEEPVAGAVFVERDGALFIRYIERGTGHIFETDTATRARERLVDTTVPRVTAAIWSMNGSYVAVLREATTGTTAALGTLVTTESGDALLETTPLPSALQNVAFSPDGETLHYTVPDGAGSAGYAHDPISGERRVLFQTPLRHITVSSWEPLLIYTTPSARMAGYAYTGASLERLVGGLPGLMAMRYGDTLIASYAEDGALVSEPSSAGSPPPLIPVFPEKCTTGSMATTTVWCAAPMDMPSGDYPDVWYQGAVSFDDILWELNTETGSGLSINIPSQRVGEPVDVIDMMVSPDEQLLMFINKRNGGLWVQALQ